MSDIPSFKKIAKDLYFFILDDIQACSSCGGGILEYIPKILEDAGFRV